jgi:DNA topoisomerase-1
MEKNENKYKKFIENAKGNKKNSKLLKCLATTSLVDIIPIYKWWEEEAEEAESDIKWKSLEHNSVVFAPRYEPHCIPIRYKGDDITLTPTQEEIATFWAQLLDNDLSKKDITRRNFIKEFRRIMGMEKAELDDFDFSAIYNHLQKVRERNKEKTPEDKKVIFF